MTITWSRRLRCTRALRSCWTGCRRGCALCSPAGPTRRCRWRGCGPAGSSPNSARRTCGSRWRRRRRSCGRSPDWICRRPRWPRCRTGPRGGRRGCGPLCDAVTGRTGGQEMLEELDRANLFVVPLDEVRHWWRYHHLFADLLRARLERARPQRVPGLHRAAAAWHEQYGFAYDAVRQALAAGETGWAARLVERHVEALLRRREDATLDRWLSA